MRAKKIGSFVAAGFVAQGAAAISGLLLAQLMSVQDYALYTVALTMIGAVNNLTRGGVQMGLAAALGKVWPDRLEAARALASARQVRLLVSAITMPPILGFAYFLLGEAGAGSATILAVIALIAVLWYTDLYASILDQVLYFGKQAERLQLADTVIAWFRLAAVGVLALTRTLSLTTALLTNFAVVALRVPLIQLWVRKLLGPVKAGGDRQVRGTIRAIALRQIPVDVWGVAQTQITLFFLARFGTSLDLAAYGALGRIAQLLTPFAALSLAYFVPAFARVRERTLTRILGYTALVSLPGLALLGLAVVAPHLLLMLIGPAYLEQTTALIVFAATTVVLNAVQTAWSLVSHRGWNRLAWIRIPIGIAWCFIGPLVLPVGTVEGAYLFYCGFSIGTIIALGCDLFWARRQQEIRSLF